MEERVWTIVRLPEGRWGVVHQRRATGEYGTREEAVDAAVAAARKATADLYPASVLIEEAAGVREIYPKRHRKRSRSPERRSRDRDAAADAPAAGYGVTYLASKFRIPLGGARRILESVGPDRERLGAAARAYKARNLP